MRIVRLQINGFRGIKEADIRLSQTSVLVGPNSVGKTTIIEALALLLGRDGMVRGLSEHDFFGSNPQPADRIKIVATIVGFPHANPELAPEWFSMRRGGVPKWYDPTTGAQSAVYKAAPYELACDLGFQARFDHGNLEVETCRYFCDDASADDVFVEDAVVPVGIGLVRDIGFFLIPASRSWDRMLSFGSELFKRVVSSDNGLPSESILAERDRLRSPKEPLESDVRLKPVIDEVNREIGALFGSGKDLHLRVTATDSTSVLDAVTPHFGGVGGVIIPSKRQGSGLLSLQSLFLLLHFGNRRIADGKGFCLALEEPELHLPPTLQRRVLRRLKALSSQTLVSTHSPLIAGFSDPTEVLIVSNDEGVVHARPLLDKPLDSSTSNAIRTLFQLKRVEVVTALMAETVLIPEGALDHEWLSLLSRVVELQGDVDPAGAIFSATVGIVPTQSAAMIGTAKHMGAAHERVVALVDGDAAGRDYAKDLLALSLGPVLRWPDGWTIEDMVGWIIQPSDSEIISALVGALAPAPADLAELVTRLKNDNAADRTHLKGDRLAYEAIARAIGNQPACVARAAELLDAIAVVGRGGASARFAVADTAAPVHIFQP
jgi:putative ATP-dependent endonuclease of OLD family